MADLLRADRLDRRRRGEDQRAREEGGELTSTPQSWSRPSTAADRSSQILDTWLATHADGIACVIGTHDIEEGGFTATSRVRSLTPELSKGLEFDLVILIDPETFGAGAFGAGLSGIELAVDRYVAMTRATQQLVILASP